MVTDNLLNVLQLLLVDNNSVVIAVGGNFDYLMITWNKDIDNPKDLPMHSIG